MAAKSADTKKVFDVSKPGQSQPDSSSRPIIVGHKPLIGDSMIKTEAEVTKEDDTTPPINQLDDAVEIKQETSEEPVKTPKPEPEAELADKNEGEAIKVTVSPRATNLTPSEDAQDQATTDKETGANSATSNGIKSAMPELDHQPEEEQKDEPGSTASSAVGNAAAVDSVLGNAQSSREGELAEDAKQQKVMELLDNGAYKVPLASNSRHRSGRKIGGPFLLSIVLGFLLLGVGYAAVDAGFVETSFKLPFDIIKNGPVADTPLNQVTTTPKANATPAPAPNPNALTQYSMVDTGVSFSYPTVWGTVTVDKQKGYLDLNTPATPSGTLAYVVTFQKNKDIKLVVNSNKYLSAPKDGSQLGSLQWCLKGSKFYRQYLQYKSATSLTPGAITCEEGPVTATKLDDKTIYEKGIKNAQSGAVEGDLYSKNLAHKEFVVLHIKDATAKNTDAIKKLLTSVKEK